jgi:hypothetical protein
LTVVLGKRRSAGTSNLSRQRSRNTPGLGADEMKEILDILKRHILHSVSDAVFTRTSHQTKARKTQVFMSW